MDGSPGFAFQIKKVILEQSRRANVGHIGPALSITDLMAAEAGLRATLIWFNQSRLTLIFIKRLASSFNRLALW